MRKLRVALVAPTLEILGGQAVQASRLLRQWKGDAEVEAWLVPVNPAFPRALRFARSVKYLRTIVNELIYIPPLVAQIRRADVVHVFSASYSSFLLAPFPAVLIARLLGRPVVLNYRSGEAPDHLPRSRVARWTLRAVQRNVVPSRFLVGVFAAFGIDASVIPNIVDFSRFRFRERTAAPATDSLDAQLRGPLQRRVHDSGIPPGSGAVAGRDADARRRRRRRGASSRAGSRTPLERGHLCRPGRTRRDRGVVRRPRHLPAESRYRQHADVGDRSVRVRAAGRVDRSRRRPRDPDAPASTASWPRSATTRPSAVTFSTCSTDPDTARQHAGRARVDSRLHLAGGPRSVAACLPLDARGGHPAPRRQGRGSRVAPMTLDRLAQARADGRDRVACALADHRADRVRSGARGGRAAPLEADQSRRRAVTRREAAARSATPRPQDGGWTRTSRWRISSPRTPQRFVIAPAVRRDVVDRIRARFPAAAKDAAARGDRILAGDLRPARLPWTQIRTAWRGGTRRITVPTGTTTRSTAGEPP